MKDPENDRGFEPCFREPVSVQRNQPVQGHQLQHRVFVLQHALNREALDCDVEQWRAAVSEYGRVVHDCPNHTF